MIFLIKQIFVLDRVRLKLGNRLVVYFLKNRFNNRGLLYLFTLTLALLSKNAYIVRHKKSRHHFVPRFLLKKFRIPNTGQIFDYQSNQVEKQISIDKEAALLDNLYTFRDKETKLPSDFLEDHVFGSLIERAGAIVISRVLEGSFPLTDLEESVLSLFVAFQYIRTPKFISQMTHVLSYFHIAKSVPISDIFKRDFAPNAFILNRYEFKNTEFLSFLKNGRGILNGKDVNSLVIRMGIQLASSYISEQIFRKNLHILKVVEPNFLFISDNPVCILNLEQKRPVMSNLWELTQNSFVFLPLSPTVGIYYADNKSDFIDNSEETYELARMISASNANRSIFADRKSEDLRDMMNKK